MGKTQENVIEISRTDIKEPSQYKVIMHNDDFTTMEFVEEVLQVVFRHPALVAYDLMKLIHNEGKAVVGIYPMDIAISKVQKATMMARKKNFPLKITYEKN